jgi:hypothetical protein
MASQLIIVCGIVPIIFLTAALIAYAVMLRGQWDKFGQGTDPGTRQGRGEGTSERDRPRP